MGSLIYTAVLGAGFVLPLYRTPTGKELLEVQESGVYCLPIDDHTDCGDLWELMTGLKGIPQDRHQRLYVLSLRESRMIGTIRRAILVPTDIMAADALTKSMISPQMMELLTTGRLRMRTGTDRPVRIRVRVRDLNYTEKDLEEMDH